MPYKYIKSVILLCAILFFSMCAPQTPDGTPITVEEIQRVNKMCHDQGEQDKRNNVPDWFSRWAKCKQKYAMPLDIGVKPFKKRQIEILHQTLVEEAKLVDQASDKAAALRKFHAAVGRIKKELGIPVCEMKVIKRGGNSHCLDNKRALY